VVAHACNVSRDQEDYGPRPVWAKGEQDPISTNKPGMVVHTCVSIYERGIGRRNMVGGWPWTKTQDPIQKITKPKREGYMAQLVEGWSSKCKALSSNHSITKRINK
jgi:hypothetical protein